MKKLPVFLLLLPFYFQLQAQTGKAPKRDDYRQAWKALDKNDFTAAKNLLLKATEDPACRNDALSTLVILDSYLGIEENAARRYHDPLLRMQHPQPYFYALWFNAVCMGNYGKMDSLHLAHAAYIFAHPELFNGSMRAAAHYFMSFNAITLYRPTRSYAEASAIGAIDNWAFTGPFDNIAGSGFNKAYGPVAHPREDAVFKSYNNTPVQWFVPAHVENQSWVFVKTPFPRTKGLIYAQSFVKADKNISCLLCLGGSGSLKVWVNDQLLFAEPEERTTELDEYKVHCRLHKGYNRVLVQVGYADTDQPNFILRFTDKNYDPVPGLVSAASFHPYVKNKSDREPGTIPHFAEVFFKKKISADPDNPVNYLLLAKTYLRNQQYYQAQKLISSLLPAHPDNVLILLQYAFCLQSGSDVVDVRQYLEKIKSLDPGGYLSLQDRIDDLEKDKQYKEAMAVADRVEQRTGMFAGLLTTKIKLTAYQNDLPGMLALIREGCRLFPDNPTFALLLYNYNKKATNDPVKALKALTDYCSRLCNYNVTMQLAQEYISQGAFDKGIAVMKKLLEPLPASGDVYNSIAGAYFKRNQIDSAIAYLKVLSANGPYKSGPYADLATCSLRQGDTAAAVKYLRKALDCDPSLSSLRKKMRMLTGKPDLYSYFPQINEDSMIAAGIRHPYDTVHHFYYIFDLHNTLLYSEGSNEQEARTAVYIHDDKGISRFNTIYVPYNNNFQELTILKAEVVKQNGAAVPADVSDNEIVYPKLAPRDVVYYHYKLRNFDIGRLGREFWDRFYFSAAVPTRLAQYNLLAADDIHVYHQFSHDETIRPDVTSHGKFKLYAWKMQDIPALKDEPLMPPSVDAGQVLHISTIPSWNMIARWYSDLTREQSAGGLHVEALIHTLFPKGTAGLGDLEKARRIYEYVVSNIAYNDVPFMHSAYVPQKAGKTLSTRLGDCKDMAALFVALARKAGLKANLVLVETRDNGRHAMTLPSMEFNHCIVKFSTGGQDYYLELTDKYLPFRALPGDLYGAQVLNIPYHAGDDTDAKLTWLKPVNKAADVLHRKMKLTISGTDLSGESETSVTGILSSDYRGRFRNESADDINKALSRELAQRFKKPVDITEVTWEGLDHLSDTVKERMKFVVKNEIIRLGDMEIWKPNFIEIVAGSDLFTDETRTYPLVYWRYENTERYNTELVLSLPKEKAFKEIPADVDLSFDQMHYHLSYQKLSDHQLLIKRTFVTQPWHNIPAADYAKLKDFFHRIIRAESRYVSFENKS